uniref:Uncharacterized protein n=1 Tax=Eutreptiella gymnastica TaxID=73025 RepID=A0A6T1ZFH5_9EUGL
MDSGFLSPVLAAECCCLAPGAKMTTSLPSIIIPQQHNIRQLPLIHSIPITYHNISFRSSPATTSPPFHALAQHTHYHSTALHSTPPLHLTLHSTAQAAIRVIDCTEFWFIPFFLCSLPMQEQQKQARAEFSDGLCILAE